MKRDDKLISAYLEGRATQPEVEELDSRLRGDAELRRTLMQQMNVVAALEEVSERGEYNAARPTSPVSKWRDARFVGLGAITALLLVGIGVLAFRLVDRQPDEVAQPDDVRQPDAEQAVAVMQDQADAVFAGDFVPDEGQLDQGVYSLRSGLVAIEFRNGVLMTVEGPAEFEIVDELHVKLNYGQARAFAPESGQGFTIETPRAEFEDLGTEFAVSVDAKTGASDVHVFDGQVDVKRPGKKATLASLRFGDSARVLDDRIVDVQSVGPDAFPTAAEVGFRRWLLASQSLRTDADLVLYYSFSSLTKDGVLLDDAAEGSKVNGKIVGARCVTGRWPGKSALLFDQPGDRVDLEVPDELPQFTIAAWLNIDRLEHNLTPILNSKGWEAGDVHFQISGGRQTVTVGVHPRVEQWSVQPHLPFGRWIHVASVVDTDKRSTQTWIDGKLVASGRLSEEAHPSPGECVIGSWGVLHKPHKQWYREFRGRIDELALWRRAMSESEIRDLVNQGRPSAHWSHADTD